MAKTTQLQPHKVFPIEPRLIVAYALIAVLILAAIGLVLRLRYMSHAASEVRRHRKEKGQRTAVPPS